MDNWLELNKHPCWDLIYDPLRPRQTHEPLKGVALPAEAIALGLIMEVKVLLLP